MTTITQADRDGSARDRFAEKCLDVFNAGIVRRPDDKNPRGYTDYYSPYEAMMAVIALVSEAAEARARLEGAKAMQTKAVEVAAWSHMVPPDGGSPSEDECAVARAAADAIAALDPAQIVKDAAP